MLPELLQHHANMNTETIMCFIFSRSFLIISMSNKIISMSNKNYRPTTIHRVYPLLVLDYTRHLFNLNTMSPSSISGVLS